MKRTIILATILCALAILGGPTVASAAGASCSSAPVGGENAPTVNTTAGTVSETGEQGYSCTVQWHAAVTPQYESGGTWHTATEVAPQFHPQFNLQPAGSVFEWPVQGRFLTDPDWTWTPSASADTPVCAFNWRLVVDFLNSGGSAFATSTSAQTAKTC